MTEKYNQAMETLKRRIDEEGLASLPVLKVYAQLMTCDECPYQELCKKRYGRTSQEIDKCEDTVIAALRGDEV